MATVINNPSGSGEGSGTGMIVGVLLAIVIIVLFFVYGLPAMRGNQADNGSIDVNVDLPGGNGGPSGPSGGSGNGSGDAY